MITKGVRKIEKPDVVQIQLYRRYVKDSAKCYLTVIENGYSRNLHISQKVAEVLIADGMDYGS